MPEDDFYVFGDNQVIVDLTHKDMLMESLNCTQELYKEQNLYKPYENKPEERLNELWIYYELVKGLPGYKLEPRFKFIDTYDIIVTSPCGKSKIIIEVKTKPEDADFYVKKANGDMIDDKSASFKNQNQILECDFLFLCRTSLFQTVSSRYAASSSTISALFDFEALHKIEFEKGIDKKSGRPYYWINLSKYKDLSTNTGINTINTLINHIKLLP